MIIKCPKCSQYQAQIYTEDYRKMIKCSACGFNDYLKSNNFKKNEANKRNLKKV